MNRFEKIDNKLLQFANQYNAEIETEGSRFWLGYYEVPPNRIEERNISWVDGILGKSVHIFPNFRSRNVDFPKWDFINSAWLEDGKINQNDVPSWSKYLLKEVPFSEIEKNIDRLLLESSINLDAVTLSHLQTAG